MSRNRPESPSSLPSIYRTADRIIRSILDSDAPPSEISPSGELYRAIARSYSSYRRDLARNHLDRWASHNVMSSDDDFDAQRLLPRDSLSSNSSPRGTLPTSAPILPPLRSINNRRPASTSVHIPSAPSTRSRPFNSRNARPVADSHFAESIEAALDTWEHWEDELARAQRTPDDRPYNGIDMNSNIRSSSNMNDRYFQRLGDGGLSPLRTRLDLTPSGSPLPDVLPALNPQQHEAPEENRQVKRRKLDSDRLSSNFQGFQYGKYGQVRPGNLKMELVSCDGGIFSDDTARYAAENILKNDDSVYCTEGPRCNIVLRHQGATVFTLKELVIKAPRSNFTSPSVTLGRSSTYSTDGSMSRVRAGMVFISMSSDHLLNRTAQYQIQYSSPSRSVAREPPLPHISPRYHEYGGMTSPQVRARRLFNMGLDDEDNNAGVAQIPSAFDVSPSPYHVSTECSDDEADDRNVRPHGRTPNRIGILPFESDTSDDDSAADEFSMSGTEYRPRGWREQLSMAPSAPSAPSEGMGTGTVPVGAGELLTPYARFNIERNKRSCTIRFDPPVSGRFILLKMWNPRRKADDNIDIQAVIAKGYAGPRFFPSVQLQ